MNQQCKVCGEPAAGFHFGAFTCEGCKSFFGRTYNNLSSITECKQNGECVINKKNRTACKACRLRKCLLVGMSKSGSRYGRRSNWFKIHCLLQEQQQQIQQHNSQLMHHNNSHLPNQQMQQPLNQSNEHQAQYLHQRQQQQSMQLHHPLGRQKQNNSKDEHKQLHDYKKKATITSDESLAILTNSFISSSQYLTSLCNNSNESSNNIKKNYHHNRSTPSDLEEAISIDADESSAHDESLELYSVNRLDKSSVVSPLFINKFFGEPLSPFIPTTALRNNRFSSIIPITSNLLHPELYSSLSLASRVRFPASCHNDDDYIESEVGSNNIDEENNEIVENHTDSICDHNRHLLQNEPIDLSLKRSPKKRQKTSSSPKPFPLDLTII